MKLILSSCDVGNPASKQVILENLEKPIDRCKVLFFPNELSTAKNITIGCRNADLHIFDDEIPERFAELDIDYLHISGGNIFQMLDRIKKCGADRLILRYLQRGVSYIGGSAGAHIVTRNIEHLLPIDGNPTGIPDFQGLGVFEGILFCHFTQERRPLYEKAVSEGKYPVYTLTDEESIVDFYE